MDVAVLPKTFAIPDRIVLGIASGELRIFGGVVRDSAGRIVLHLKDAGMADDAARAAAKAAKKAVEVSSGKGKWVVNDVARAAVKAAKKAVEVSSGKGKWVVIGIAGVAAAGAIYHYRKSGSAAEVNLAEQVVDRINVFQDSALEYARELQSGRLSRTTLSSLQSAVERLHEILDDVEQTNLSVLQARAQIDNIRTFCDLVSNLTLELMAKGGSVEDLPPLPHLDDLIPYLQHISLLLDRQELILFPKAA